MKKPKNKGGRPKELVDMDKLATFMRFRPTQQDCADFFGVSVNTIDRRIKEATGETYLEFRNRNFVKTRFNLINNALLRAEKSDTLLVFCLKNFCGWRDKIEQETTVSVKPYVMQLTDGSQLVMGHDTKQLEPKED